jgi:hypothetical protein
MMMIDDDCESTIFDRTVVEFYKGQTYCVGSFWKLSGEASVIVDL